MKKMTWKQLCIFTIENYGTNEYERFINNEYGLIDDMMDEGRSLSDIKAATLLPNTYLTLLIVYWKIFEKAFDAYWVISGKVKKIFKR